VLKKYAIIKEKLFEARTSKGLSQEELADLIGMTQPNYSRRENGLKKISDTEWVKIAKELGVKKEDIYEEDSQKVVYKNIKGNSFNYGNISYFNVPDFVLEHIELLKTQNAELKQENQAMKKEIENLKQEN
jgi:transcriptional regulator with XRE-family HTH domain